MEQQIIWTALPNGKNGQRLKLSAHVSIRLNANGPTGKIGDFPTVVGWNPSALVVTVMLNGHVVPARAVHVVTDPAPVAGLWQQYFPASGIVNSFHYVPSKPGKFGTFHSSGIGQYLTQLHAENAVQGFLPRASVLDLVKDPLISQAIIDKGALVPAVTPTPGKTKTGPIKKVGRISPEEAMDDDSDQVKAAANKFPNSMANQSMLDRSIQLRVNDPRVLQVQALRKLGKSPTETHLQLVEAHLYFRPTEAQKRIPMEAPKFDFHQALSNVGQHPALMRKLGLVIDLEIDAGALPATGTVSVSVSGMPGAPHVLPAPETHYLLSNTDFRAAPRGTNVVDGFLSMDPGVSEVSTVDLNGGMLQTINYAHLIARKAARLTAIAPVRKAFLKSLPTDTAVKSVSSSPHDDTAEHLPALRSAGISVLFVNRSKHMDDSAAASDSINTAATGGTAPQLYAEDLQKGWRPDIREGATWKSLTARQNTYRLAGALVDTVDEGQVSNATAKTADSDQEKVHESLFTWQGWSLVAHRPGKVQDDDGTLTQPEPTNKADFETWSANASHLDPVFRFASFAKPAPGSLPKLRFGHRYGVRVRTVDLAGNSQPLAFDHADSTTPTWEDTVYLRHEPVLSPNLFLREAPKARGESAYILVVRKFVSASGETQSVRHIIPPNGGEYLAECHGVLDDSQGKPDPAKYALIQQSDQRPDLPDVIASDNAPGLPFLPDPCANGATLRPASPVNLPLVKTAYYQSAQWPNPQCSRLQLSAGSSTAATASGNTLSVTLQPGQMVDFLLGSNVANQFLADFQQTWALEQALRAQSLSLATKLQAMHPALTAKAPLLTAYQPFQVKPKAQISKFNMKPKKLPVQGPDLDALLRSYADGVNYALTPAHPVRMIYAVQVPEPGFAMTSIKPTRTKDKSYADVALSGNVHSWSTGEIEFLAQYSDDFDDLAEPIRTTKSVVRQDRAFAVSVPYVDAQAVNPLSESPQHEFHDAKCHFVRYTMIAKTRYSGYFPVEWPIEGKPETRLSTRYYYRSKTEAGPSEIVVVPASKKPAALEIEQIIPAFQWQKGGSNGRVLSGRKGNLFRIYLRRPWFSSGNEEQLGVVLTNALDSTPAGDKKWAFSTLLGADPAFADKPISGIPTPANFPGATQVTTGVWVDESQSDAIVVSYTPEFDDAKQLWYVDLEVRPHTESYRPFLKLALARFQPHADPKLQLGSVTVAEITQLQPDRLAIVETITPGKQIHATLVGVIGHSAGSPNRVFARLEKRSGSEDTGWTQEYGPSGAPIETELPVLTPGAAGDTGMDLFHLASNRTRIDVIQKPVVASPKSPQSPQIFKPIPHSGPSGLIDLPSSSAVYRIVLEEYEVHPSESGYPPVADQVGVAGRLVHVDAIVLS